MENTLSYFSQYGLSGLIIAVLFFQNFFLVRKIINVVENNTQTMTQLKDNCARRVVDLNHDR